MSARRLARLSQSQTTGLQTTNWTTQATETYDGTNPATGPSSWGTDPEIANLDRDLDKTGSLKQHLGLLATFTSAPDDFWGAIVKLQVTFGPSDDPQLELWTHDTTNGWVKRRKLDVTALGRSGDTTIFDLTLATPLTGVDRAWITLVPTSTETNNWLVSHLYGDCDAVLAIPDCPAFSDPPDCSLPWPESPGGTPVPLPLPPDPPGPIPTSFPLPPIIVSVPDPPLIVVPGNTPPSTAYVFDPAHSGYRTACPGPTQIRMYFDIRNGGSITVTPLDTGGIIFVEGSSQTVSGSTFIDWTVQSPSGFTLAGNQAPRGAKFLWPAPLHAAITFLFTPSVNFAVLDFFDWEQFLYTYDILCENEIC